MLQNVTVYYIRELRITFIRTDPDPDFIHGTVSLGFIHWFRLRIRTRVSSTTENFRLTEHS